MILIGNQMVYLKAREIIRIWKKRAWNYSLISLVTIYLHILSSLGRGEKRKESLQLRRWNLNICIEIVDAKCWLAEMTFVMTSLPLARVFQCLVTFALVSASRWLPEIWQLSRPEATGELEVEFKSHRRSCKLSFLFPPRRQSTPESLLQAILLFASFSCVFISVITYYSEEIPHPPSHPAPYTALRM